MSDYSEYNVTGDVQSLRQLSNHFSVFKRTDVFSMGDWNVLVYAEYEDDFVKLCDSIGVAYQLI